MLIYKKIFGIEIIKVTVKELIMTERFLFSKSRYYLISEISHFAFAGKHDFTSHPLEIKSNDAIGWHVSETESQTLIEDDSIHFFCDGLTLRFANNVDSLDVEKIINIIEKFSQNDLSSDDKTEFGMRRLYKKKQNNNIILMATVH